MATRSAIKSFLSFSASAPNLNHNTSDAGILEQAEQFGAAIVHTGGNLFHDLRHLVAFDLTVWGESLGLPL